MSLWTPTASTPPTGDERTEVEYHAPLGDALRRDACAGMATYRDESLNVYWELADKAWQRAKRRLSEIS